MPDQAVEYRLRIRNASTTGNPNGTADALTITSTAGGTNPYIAAPPSGDGQEVDPVTGQTRTGSYVVEIVDAATGTDGTGTIRVVTNALEDAGYLQQLLGRRAYVEINRAGAGFTTLTAGYVLAVRLVAPARYAITVGDTRRVEQTQPIFQGSALGSYTTRGTLTGGPVTADFGPVKARGGWTYKIYRVGATDDWYAEFESGYLGYVGAPIVRDFRQLINATVVNTIAGRATFNPNSVSLFGSSFSQYVTLFLGITVYVNGTATTAKLCGYSETQTSEALGYSRLYFYWPGATVSSGQTVQISLATEEVSQLCPLYLDAHPVDIVTAIWTAARIQYDTGGAWIAAVRAAIGANVRLALRLTEAPTIADFIESAICGPFGVAVRTNGSGDQELVVTRIQTTATPSLTIAAADLTSAEPVVFDLDERTAINTVTLTQQVLTPASLQGGPNPQQNLPPDGLLTTEVSQTARYVDAALSTFAGRDITYRVPGMIHTAADFSQNPTDTLNAIGRGILPRFGRGSPVADVELLATAASAAAQVGDEVYLQAPHYPNRNYRIGESSVGARIMQVVRRTESPTGPMLRLIDSGIDAQPVSPAATITIAASTANPYAVAQFTITNAATINSGAVLGVEVEWGTGATPTSNGIFIRYLPGAVPTGAVNLTAVQGSGTQVQVRARTTQTGRRPSAWTAWASVTLTAIPTPGAISIGTTTDTSVAISWTNTSTAFPLFVYAYLGGAAPAQWDPYLVTTLPPGSTSTIIRTLEAGTYQLAIAYSTPTGPGPLRTSSVTTVGSGGTATRPAGVALIPLLDDATLEQGIALGLYASDQSLDIVVERSLAAGFGFAQIARVPGSTAVYVDRLPRDGTTYYYRLKHALGGFVTSAATGEVQDIARGVPSEVLRPAPVVPIVQVQVSETVTTGTVTLVITDPQGRLTQVRFREDTGSGFGSWTVDTVLPYEYTGTIPATGFLRIEYEVTAFAADGIARVIAAGIEAFDRNATANIVSATATFTLAGALSLAIQADTDTASFKYAIATTPWADDAAAYTAAQAGTLVNARNLSTTLAGPYAVGSSVYLTIAAYTGASGAGTVSGPYRYTFTNGSRDTIPLLARARVTSTTSTTVVVRVAVATPVALDSPGTASIAFSELGVSGTSPASPQTVTPTVSDTITEVTSPAQNYVDFTITRPAVGAAPGRVTFLVTATGRVAAVDAVDVVPQERVGPSLKVVTTPGASSYSLVITYDGTIAYALDGVTQSVSGWTSPYTLVITRGDIGANTQVAALSVTKDSITISESINVPPKDITSASLSIPTQTADDTTETYEFDWTASGFPTGTTYDLNYRTVTTNGDVEEGFFTGLTLTNQDVTSGYNIGANPTYQMTVTAVLSGSVLMSRSRTGTFLT